MFHKINTKNGEKALKCLTKTKVTKLFTFKIPWFLFYFPATNDLENHLSVGNESYVTPL